MLAPEVYREGESRLHRRDARAKLLAVTALVVCAVTSDWRHPERLGVCALALLVLLALGRLPPLPILRRSLVVLPFLLVPAASAPFLRKALDPEASLWVVMAVVAGRAWLASLLLVSLMACTRYADLLEGAARLGMPRILVSLGGFMYRYLFVLTDEAGRMLQARDLRLYGQSTLVAGSRVAGTMVAALFLRTWDRAERIHQGMLVRGVEGTPRRPAPRPLDAGDWTLLVAAALTIAAAVRLA